MLHILGLTFNGHFDLQLDEIKFPMVTYFKQIDAHLHIHASWCVLPVHGDMWRGSAGPQGLV